MPLLCRTQMSKTLPMLFFGEEKVGVGSKSRTTSGE